MRASEAAKRIGAIAVLTVGSLGAAAPQPPITDPDAIFANARAAWAQGGYPRYGTYATAVDFQIGTRHVHSTWDTIEDFRHETVYARKFNREESANPGPPPKGINFEVPFFGNLAKQEESDPVGHVAFAVDQSYGLANKAIRISAASSAQAFSSASSTLTTIGRTGVIARIYAIRLAETLTDAHGVEYHLILTPLINPDRNRLREVWIDGTTWLPEQAIVAGIGNRAPLNGVLWRVEFRQVAGATYVAVETALADVDFGGAGIAHGLTVSFDEFTPRAFPPATFALGDSGDKPLSDP